MDSDDSRSFAVITSPSLFLAATASPHTEFKVIASDEQAKGNHVLFFVHNLALFSTFAWQVFKGSSSQAWVVDISFLVILPLAASILSILTMGLYLSKHNATTLFNKRLCASTMLGCAVSLFAGGGFRQLFPFMQTSYNMLLLWISTLVLLFTTAVVQLLFCKKIYNNQAHISQILRGEETVPVIQSSPVPYTPKVTATQKKALRADLILTAIIVALQCLGTLPLLLKTLSQFDYHIKMIPMPYSTIFIIAATIATFLTLFQTYFRITQYQFDKHIRQCGSRISECCGRLFNSCCREYESIPTEADGRRAMRE